MTISPERLEELQSIPDSEIDLSEIPELDADFWKEAKIVRPTTKKSISLRLDKDVLDWFKGQGKGYQSLMNSVLRSYVEHQIKLNK
ncbi:BrnA antitoxin family protein [Myxacorys almedinensis]|uniref:3-oxoacyl-ACP synthase n=1 Tax=Myxacorys almedinensis A TaxID=2690445 RepID=A0A8J8CI39_9CYAN|nr:BrnA antitoxin family protein [Myxacorys almedinensis]NDJ17358.1 3-oxoacyl-ACP synthase [Myxacorys almedinensis A]